MTHDSTRRTGRQVLRQTTEKTRSGALAAVALTAAIVLAGCGTETGAGGDANDGTGGGGGGGGSEESGGTAGNGAADGAAAVDFSTARWIPERVTIGGEEYVRPAEDTESYLVLRPGGAKRPNTEGGNSGGRLACNSFGTHATFADDTVTVGRSVSTRVGCPENQVAFAEHFMDVFQGELTYEVADVGDHPQAADTLTLTNPAGDTIELTEAPG